MTKPEVEQVALWQIPLKLLQLFLIAARVNVSKLHIVLLNLSMRIDRSLDGLCPERHPKSQIACERPAKHEGPCLGKLPSGKVASWISKAKRDSDLSSLGKEISLAFTRSRRIDEG